MQHDRNQRVIGLNVDHDGTAGRQQSAKQPKRVQSTMGQNVELVHGGLTFPGSANRNRAVTGWSAIGEEQILLRPSRATVDRIMDDLAIHLQAIHVAPWKDVSSVGRSRREFHACHYRVLHRLQTREAVLGSDHFASLNLCAPHVSGAPSASWPVLSRCTRMSCLSFLASAISSSRDIRFRSSSITSANPVVSSERWILDRLDRSVSRAIAWRAADSFALREFLGLVLPAPPFNRSRRARICAPWSSTRRLSSSNRSLGLDRAGGWCQTCQTPAATCGYGSTAVMFRFGTWPTGIWVSSLCVAMSMTDTEFDPALAT